MLVDTRTVPGRRHLHFHSLDELLADVEHLGQGKIRALGNWSPGQILRHIATPMHCCIDGVSMQIPWWGRIFGWLFKSKILNNPMPPGFRLSKEAAKSLTFGTTSWEEGVQTLRAGIHRLKTEKQRARSPFLGQLTREEWDRFHCRHAELHLSFLVPAER